MPPSRHITSLEPALNEVTVGIASNSS